MACHQRLLFTGRIVTFQVKKKKSRGRVTLHRRHVEVLGKGIVEFEKSIWIPAEEVSTLIGSINQDKKHKTTAESNGLPEE